MTTIFDTHTGEELEFFLPPEEALIVAFERIQLANPDPCSSLSATRYRFRMGTRTMALGRFIALKESRQVA
jgi:hypothetical protein